ncbi:MAG: glycoside hydrolase family 16 protein [Rubrivivax sp.]|nr:glycoside hydrolase family 16 protein [Rubrivivax sp.]
MGELKREAAHAGRPGMRVRRAAAGALLVGLLQIAACGGGGESAPPAAAPPAPPTPPTPPVAAGPAPVGYRLVWSDEFDVPGLPDATRWAYDTERNRLGWYNNERQYYAAARTENSRVADGRLRITARLEDLRSAADWGGQRYTSARLVTRGHAAWTYGFFEVRAKLPCGRGTWPAIWMLGTGGVWPDDGEIDIMEQVGSNPSRVFGTVHTRAGSGGASTGAATQVSDACTAFHDYQLHWTASEIAIGIDGVVHFRYPNPGTGRDRWPFNAPQYLLLNIAIGGDLGGAVDDGIFPVTMEIEHVRIWQPAPP